MITPGPDTPIGQATRNIHQSCSEQKAQSKVVYVLYFTAHQTVKNDNKTNPAYGEAPRSETDPLLLSIDYLDVEVGGPFLTVGNCTLMHFQWAVHVLASAALRERKGSEIAAGVGCIGSRERPRRFEHLGVIIGQSVGVCFWRGYHIFSL